MCSLNSLPDSVVEIILSYSANRISDKLKSEIQQKYVEKKLNEFDHKVVDVWLDSLCNSNRKSFHAYVKSALTQKEKDNWIQIMKKCNCCKGETELVMGYNSPKCMCLNYIGVLERV